MVEVIKWKVNKVEVNIKTCHVTYHVTSILKILVRAAPREAGPEDHVITLLHASPVSSSSVLLHFRLLV